MQTRQGMSDEQTHRVLVIDDDLALIRMVRLSFVSEGFTVLTANDGLQGLDVLAKEQVDAIVLDLLMPRMDGRSFYLEMRSRGFDLPVVIVSAYGADTARSELGAEAALSKPFDPDILINEVRRLIASRPSDGERGNLHSRIWQSDRPR
jgi:DNA-binding response OmpR family regulator